MELVDILFNRNELYEGVKQGMGNMYPAIVRLVKDKIQEDEYDEDHTDRVMRSFEDFQERFVKEAMWLWDGQFERLHGIIKEEMNNAYSEQEQKILVDFYQSNPWVLPKQKVFGNLVAQKILPVSVEVAQQAIKNLEERGEIEEIEAKISGAGED